MEWERDGQGDGSSTMRSKALAWTERVDQARRAAVARVCEVWTEDLSRGPGGALARLDCAPLAWALGIFAFGWTALFWLFATAMVAGACPWFVFEAMVGERATKALGRWWGRAMRGWAAVPARVVGQGVVCLLTPGVVAIFAPWQWCARTLARAVEENPRLARGPGRWIGLNPLSLRCSLAGSLFGDQGAKEKVFAACSPACLSFWNEPVGLLGCCCQAVAPWRSEGGRFEASSSWRESLRGRVLAATEAKEMGEAARPAKAKRSASSRL